MSILHFQRVTAKFYHARQGCKISSGTANAGLASLSMKGSRNFPDNHDRSSPDEIWKFLDVPHSSRIIYRRFKLPSREEKPVKQRHIMLRAGPPEGT
jgi:hypothetical protein